MRRAGAKWHGTPPGAVSASVADMELPAPDVIMEAVLEATRAGGGYPSPGLERRVLAAAADWWQRHGAQLDPTAAIAIGSVTPAAAFALVRCSEPGDGVVRLRPTYPPLVDMVEASDRRDVPVDLVRGEPRWELDLDALEAAAAEATVLLWVAPHNPTGRVWDRDEVAAVAEVAARHDLTVIADEIWADVLLDGAEHVPFEAVARDVDPDLLERTVTLVGTSKAWNLATMGAAVLHTPSDELYRRFHGPGHVPLLTHPSRPALVAAAVAWEQGGPWLADTLALLEDNVTNAVTTWQQAFGGDRVLQPEGTYLVWVDLRDLVPDDDPMAALAVPDGVVPSDGATFGAPGFARFNLATTTEEAAVITARVAALLG